MQRKNDTVARGTFLGRSIPPSLLARLAISALLIGWLLRNVDLRELADVLYRSQWWLFALSTFILLARTLIGSLRWQIILASQGTRVPVLQLTYWYLVGGFFNMFLPTALGGDVMRVYEAGKSTGKMTQAAVSVMMERMIGLTGMIGLALPALLVAGPAQREPTIYWSVFAIVVTFACALITIFHPVSCRGTAWLLRRLRLASLAGQLQQGHQALLKLVKHRRTMIYALSLTFCFHVIGVYCTYLIGLALGVDVPFIYYCTAVPTIWVITMLPISLNGIGVREGSFVLFFTAVGVTHGNALLLSLLTFAQLTILGLFGGLLYSAIPWVLLRRGPGSLSCRDLPPN